ncbi:MAG: TadE/TadG family type IV pilus assembly protein [Arachnia sp.]
MRNERGSLAVWTAMVMPAFVLCVGLGVDFSGHAAAQQEARAVAAEAARAAGQYLQVSDGRARPDKARAERAARDFVSGSSLTGMALAEADGRITVTVRGRYATQFLGMIGINSLPLEATASARVISVIAGNEE